MTHWYCENRGNLINQIFPDTPANETGLIDNPDGYLLNSPEQKQQAIDIRNSIWQAVKDGRTTVKKDD